MDMLQETAGHREKALEALRQLSYESQFNSLSYGEKRRAGVIVASLPETLRGDRQILQLAIQIYPEAIAMVGTPAFADKALVLQALRHPEAEHRQVAWLKQLPAALYQDAEVMLEAVPREPACFAQMSENLRESKEFVLQLLGRSTPSAQDAWYAQLPEVIRNDQEVALAAIARSSQALKALGPDFGWNRDFALQVLTKVPREQAHEIFARFPETLRDDLVVARAAVSTKSLSILHCGPAILADKEFVLAGIAAHQGKDDILVGLLAQKLSPKLLADADVAKALMGDSANCYPHLGVELRARHDFALSFLSKNAAQRLASMAIPSELFADTKFLERAVVVAPAVLDHIKSPIWQNQEQSKELVLAAYGAVAIDRRKALPGWQKLPELMRMDPQVKLAAAKVDAAVFNSVAPTSDKEFILSVLESFKSAGAYPHGYQPNSIPGDLRRDLDVASAMTGAAGNDWYPAVLHPDRDALALKRIAQLHLAGSRGFLPDGPRDRPDLFQKYMDPADFRLMSARVHQLFGIDGRTAGKDTDPIAERMEAVSSSRSAMLKFIEKHAPKSYLSAADGLPGYQKEVYLNLLASEILNKHQPATTAKQVAPFNIGCDELLKRSQEIKGWRMAAPFITADTRWATYLAGQNKEEITEATLSRPAPYGLAAVDPYAGFQKTAYESICQKFGVDPWAANGRPADRKAAHSIAQLFAKDLGKAERYISEHPNNAGQAAKAPANKLHDAGQFSLPEANAYTREAWAAVVAKHPESTRFSGRFGDYEKAFGIPANLNDLRQGVVRLGYGNVQAADRAIAEQCAKLGLSAKEFTDVVAHARAPKTEAWLPDVALVGQRELEGYRLRLLEPGDIKALVIGADSLSACCQRVGGVGAAAALHSYKKPSSGVYVVEDKRGDLVAQSFAWLDADRKTVVFDSVESKFRDAGHIGAAAAMLKELAVELKNDGYTTLLSKTDYGMTADVAKVLEIKAAKDGAVVPQIHTPCAYLDCYPGTKAHSLARIVSQEMLFRTHETQRVGRDIEKLPALNIAEWEGTAKHKEVVHQHKDTGFETKVDLYTRDDKVLMHVVAGNGKELLARETHEFDLAANTDWMRGKTEKDLVKAAVKMVDERIKLPEHVRAQISAELAKVEHVQQEAVTAIGRTPAGDILIKVPESTLAEMKAAGARQVTLPGEQASVLVVAADRLAASGAKVVDPAGRLLNLVPAPVLEAQKAAQRSAWNDDRGR